jgi:two-component system response regulator HydG
MNTVDDSMTVLVVEGDPAMTAMLAEHLRRRGLEAHHAENLDEALSAVKVRGFDSIIAEISLGHRSEGFELCARVHAQRPEVAVILTTAFGDHHTEDAALRAGASDFVAKPFALDELDARLRRAVERSRSTRPLGSR